MPANFSPDFRRRLKQRRRHTTSNSMRRAKLTLQLAAAFAWLITHGVASADSFPKRTVKVAVPFSASSGPTLLVRLIGDKLSAIWPQRVVVEPKPGASG